MTLILAAATRGFAVLASDRRFTIDGADREDESNKATTFACANGRFAVGFSGLARVAHFSTEDWLVDELASAGAASSHVFWETIECIAADATRKFTELRRRWRPNPGADRLSILLLGYAYAPDGPRPCCFLVSNFDKFGEEPQGTASQDFVVDCLADAETPHEWPTLFVSIGAEAALDQSDAQSIVDLLKSKAPPPAVRDRMVAAIRRAAESPKSHDLIGKQVNTVILPADPDRDAECGYHSDAPTPQIFVPNHVVSTPEVAMSFKGIYLGAVDESGAPVLAIPRVGRNARCPCASGKKYKRCHGAHPDGPAINLTVGPQ